MVKLMDESRPRAGLLIKGRKPVPLEGVKVEADVKDFCTRVRLAQRYCNREDHPIEAVYVFPLDEAAAVCGFEALIDDLHVAGEVMEREEAFEQYDDALAAGHGAYLLDQERPDVFTASIGNVPPGKQVTVRVTYVTELGLEGDDLRFVLPTTVSPRYAPAEDRKGVGKTPAEAVNPPLDWRVPYGLEITVNLEMASAIRALESPSHAIKVEMEGCRATVNLGNRETPMDRDFVLLARLAEPWKPRAWVERDEKGKRAVMVAFQPEFSEEEAGEVPAEVIFVVDRSGSMMGTSIAEAKNALQLCLRSLPEKSHFNIIGFGSTFEMLFPESRPYDDESLKEASRQVNQLDANLGGTEILAPLEAVFSTKLIPGIPRQLLVLTDGQVSNTGAVISLIRKHSTDTRVFTFGIGAGASHHLVKGMARAGEGAAEFIYPGERIEEKVLRQLGKALSPTLTDVQLDWGDLAVKQAPYRVPPVFSQGRVLVYGFLESGQAGVVSLGATGPKGRVSFQVTVDAEQAPRDNLIATLAARTMIRDLEEGMSSLHDRRGSLQKRGREKKVKEEIIRLGVTYGLCSRETSFVAVEKRQTPVKGRLELRKIPVALTRGWGGLEDAFGPSFPAAARAAAAPSGKFLLGDSSLALQDTGAFLLAEDFHLAAAGAPSPVERGPRRRHAEKKEAFRDLDRLVRLQHANGSWDLTKGLARILQIPLARMKKKLADAVGPRRELRQAWATALALAWLHSEAGDCRGEWLLLEKKARKWLRQCPAKIAGGEDWLEAAASFLRQK